MDEAELDKYLPPVLKKLGWLSGEDLIKRILSLEFHRLLEYYKDAPEIDFIDEKPSRGKKERDAQPRSKEDKDRRTASKGMERIYINAGKKDGFFAGNLIELLNKTIQGPRVDVGRIDLLPSYSLFDVKKADARRIVAALNGADFLGKRLYSEIAEADKDYARASTRRSREKAREKEDNYAIFKKKGRRKK